MKLLIVDDEYYSAMGIKQQLSTAQLGLESIACAFSAAQAREYISGDHFDILITDIQMPKGDGLELVAWCREQHPNLVCIFLTAFASFDYAKKAVNLQGFEYLLKPVAEEQLLLCVKNAMEKADDIKEQKAKEAQANYWQQAYPKLVEQFWLDLGRKLVPPEISRIQEHLSLLNLPVEFSKNSYTLLMVRYWEQNGLPLTTALPMESIQHYIKEAFIDSSLEDYHRVEMEDAICLLMFGQNLPAENIPGLIAKLSSDAVNKGLMLTYICAAQPVDALGFQELYAHMLWQIKNRYNAEGNINPEAETGLETVSASLIPAMRWSEMMHKGQYEALIEEVDVFLKQHQLSPGFMRGDLVLFYHDFLQVLYSVMEDYKASPSQLMDGFIYQDCLDNACRSIPDMRVWIAQTLQDFHKNIRGEAPTTDAVADTAQYIQQHLSEPLERDHLASLVFVSPDHLSHLFRQQKGMSLSNYIMEQRLAKARELLLTTRQNIRDIAFACGFQNESYFISQFKKKYGKTPLNYRKKE